MEPEGQALFAEGPDRLLSPAELAAMPGLDFVRGMRDGRLPHPPICRALDFRLVEAEDGRVAFEGRPGFASYNPLGAIHGGWFGALLDSAMSCAVQTRLPQGRGYTTLEYKVSMLRPATLETGPLRATGRAVHVGRRTGVAEGRMEDSAGRLYATGSATCLVFELQGGSMAEKRLEARISGRVQGVNFRAWTQEQAEARGLRGWVRNCPDGSVEAVFAGPSGTVDEMLELCREGPAVARVDSVETRDLIEDPGVTGFEVRR